MSVTQDEMNRVIYSKYLLGRAAAHQAQGTDLGSAQAILAAHDGAEMLIQVVYDHLGITSSPDFMAFWKEIKKATGIEPRFNSAMKSLNNQRNEFKYRGKLPHLVTVTALLPSVVAFCEDVSQTHLKVDYANASLTALIQNAEAKKYLEEAISAHTNANTQVAFESLRLAFDELYVVARKKYEKDLPSKLRWQTPHHRTGHSEIDRQIESLVRSFHFDKIIAHINDLTETLDVLLLGVDAASYRRFSRTVPFTLVTGLLRDNKSFMWTKQVPDLTDEDFEFCYSFVLDFGLREV